MHPFETFLVEYGPIVVVLGAFLEGEFVVMLSGFAAHQGLLNPYVAVVCAFLGSFAWDQMIYLVARRRAGSSLVTRLRRWPAFGQALELLQRHPTLFVLSFRFIYGLRTTGAAAIGLAQVPPRRFLPLNALAAAIWAAAVVAIGYFFGAAAEAALGELGRFEHRALVGLAGAAIVLGLVLALRRAMLRRAATPAS